MGTAKQAANQKAPTAPSQKGPAKSASKALKPVGNKVQKNLNKRGK